MADDATAVFQDEGDLTTNPKSDARGMVRGQPAEVETPGHNEKRPLSGSIPGRTGQVFLTPGKPKRGRHTVGVVPGAPGRMAEPAPAVQEDPCYLRQMPGPPSDEGAVDRGEHRERIEGPRLPKSSPACNPIERVWWNLPDRITRAHRGETREEQLDRTFAWLGSRNPFKVEDKVDRTAA